MTETDSKSRCFKLADRLEKVPPYLFQVIDDMKADAKSRGIEIVSLGIGDPDQPTPPEIVEELYKQAQINEMQKYPAYRGTDEMRQALTDFYQRRFGVQLNPQT
ncbi:aminotransferase class I/II-fold pyridoxal phosphate-dependent enzyme, partial [bacterium]|nr:aminotransferase class I/II-fold pyridoxal phosphate-dependent enzyme [bacterium]